MFWIGDYSYVLILQNKPPDFKEQILKDVIDFVMIQIQWSQITFETFI